MTATYVIAVSDTNSGYIYDATYLHTDGIAMPTGNNTLDSTTNQPIKIYTITAEGQSGSGLYKQIVYRGFTSTGNTLWSDSGSTFEFRVGHTVNTSQLFYGRDSSYAGRNIYLGAGTGTIERAGQSLAGSFTYAFVPKAPSSLAATQTARSIALTATAASGTGFDGYATISSYKVQYRTSSDGTTWGAWGNTQTMTSLAYTYSNLAPATYYQFRTYAVNDVGNSAATVNATTFYVAAGGRIYNGTSWVPATTFKVYNGTAWVDVTTARVYNGTSWADITI